MKYIKKYAPDCISHNKITYYKNTTIGIDANLMIYKLIYAIRGNGYDIKNDGKIVTHIHALLLKLVAFKKYGITPVFVFDNSPPKIKYKTLGMRTDAKNKMINKYKNDKTKEGKRIYYYVKTDITKKEIDDCKKLIQLFGFMIVDAAEEADAQLAYMSKKHIIDYIASDDMDILVFGGKILLKNFSVSETKYIEEINLDKLKKSLGFNQMQLIYTGILLGSDYCHNKLVSVGKTYDLVNEYKTISNIPSDIFDTECSDAINYFKNPPVININKIAKNKMNSDGLLKMLLSNNFNDVYIDKIKKLIS